MQVDSGRYKKLIHTITSSWNSFCSGFGSEGTTQIAFYVARAEGLLLGAFFCMPEFLCFHRCAFFLYNRLGRKPLLLG